MARRDHHDNSSDDITRSRAAASATPKIEIAVEASSSEVPEREGPDASVGALQGNGTSFGQSSAAGTQSIAAKLTGLDDVDHIKSPRDVATGQSAERSEGPRRSHQHDADDGPDADGIMVIAVSHEVVADADVDGFPGVVVAAADDYEEIAFAVGDGPEFKPLDLDDESPFDGGPPQASLGREDSIECT